MCLRLPWYPISPRKTAKEPITVYKFLYRRDAGVYTSPFQGAIYIIGEEYFADVRAEYGSMHVPMNVVEVGIHSIVKFEDIDWMVKTMREDWHYDYKDICILECEIPAGAAYYTGKWGFDFKTYFKSIASSQLKIIREVETTPGPNKKRWSARRVWFKLFGAFV